MPSSCTRTARLLLGRRTDNGLWAVVSGILEPGELPAHAATREVLEATGVVARVEALAAVWSDPEAVVNASGDRAQYLDLMFVCRAVAGEVHVADDESVDVGWFAPDALPEPLARSSHVRITRALAYREDPTCGTWFDRP